MGKPVTTRDKVLKQQNVARNLCLWDSKGEKARKWPPNPVQLRPRTLRLLPVNPVHPFSKTPMSIGSVPTAAASTSAGLPVLSLSLSLSFYSLICYDYYYYFFCIFVAFIFDFEGGFWLLMLCIRFLIIARYLLHPFLFLLFN